MDVGNMGYCSLLAVKALSKGCLNGAKPAYWYVFAIYKPLASPEQIEQMRANYLGGNYGYGHAKHAWYELITEMFKTEREKYTYGINNLTEVDAYLKPAALKPLLLLTRCWAVLR